MSVTELNVAYEAGPGDDSRLPPQDLHAEESVLGGMLLSKDAIADCVEVLRGLDFYRPQHESIYEAILDLYGRGEPADAITVADELTKRGDLARIGGQAYLHQLISRVPTAANAGYYAQIVAERATLRRLVEAGTRIVQMGYGSGGGDVEDIVNAAQAEVYGVTDSRGGEDYHILGDLLEMTADEIEAASGTGGQMVGVPTGFLELDELTNGLHPGQMIVVAARPAVGKSTLALDFARAAAIKHQMATVVFSLEMSRTEITMRLLSAEASIQLQHMRKGTMRDDDWQKLARTMGSVSDAPLFIDDSPNMSLMEIRAKCRRLKQRHNLKMVVIDYLQLMTSGKRVESRQQEVSEFSRALKLLAKELEVPVIAISQLNRGPEQRTDKKPMVSDLRESGCLTADTRVVRADTNEPVTLGELFASGARDIPVWSLDESLRCVQARMTHVFDTGVRPVFRMRLASGRSIRATANHPFLKYSGWTPLGNLEPGDRIAVPRLLKSPTSLTSWSPWRIIFLAHMLGDGSFVRRQPIRYTSMDETCLSAVAQAAQVEFGITAVRDQLRDRSTSLRLPAPFRLARGVRNPISAWFDELGIFGARSHEKFVPSEVFTMSKDQVSLFLQHLWATDGSVTVANGGRKGRIYYATESRRLAEDVAFLLLRWGVVARIGKVPQGRFRPLWTVDVSGRDDQTTFLREIGVFGDRAVSAAHLLQELSCVPANTNVDTVPLEVWDVVRRHMNDEGVTTRAMQAALGTKYCGSAIYKSAMSRERLRRVASVVSSSSLRDLSDSDVLWDRVLEIVPDGVEQVYDATVPGTHNFVADGIVVHNSIEQDADVVMLLHRESMYEQDSPREGEADIMVAKHRNGPTKTITVAFQGHYSRFTNMATNY